MRTIKGLDYIIKLANQSEDSLINADILNMGGEKKPQIIFGTTNDGVKVYKLYYYMWGKSNKQESYTIWYEDAIAGLTAEQVFIELIKARKRDLEKMLLEEEIAKGKYFRYLTELYKYIFWYG